MRYNATVVRIQTDDSGTLMALEVDSPIGPLIRARTGWMVLSAELTGLKVPAGALTFKDGQSGVMLDDPRGSIFVQVQVLSRGPDGILVTPVIPGGLLEGNRVLVN